MKKRNIRKIVILLVGLFCLAGCGGREEDAEPLQSTFILPDIDGERTESSVEESSDVGEEPQNDRIQKDAGTGNIQNGSGQTGGVKKGVESSPADVEQISQEATSAETQTEDGYSEEAESSSGHYLMVTSLSDEEVESFAAKVKEQILKRDFAGLADEIVYPITIDGVVYEDAAAFLEASILLEMNPDFLTELEAENCREMFANYQGIMLGNGIVWIAPVSGELKIIGINGMTVQ